MTLVGEGHPRIITAGSQAAKQLTTHGLVFLVRKANDDRHNKSPFPISMSLVSPLGRNPDATSGGNSFGAKDTDNCQCVRCATNFPDKNEYSRK